MSVLPSTSSALPGGVPDLTLVPLFRGVWRIDPMIDISSGPTARRLVLEMHDGRLEGRGIVATTKGRANADWMLVGPDGIGTGDWRGTVETESGATIYLSGGGRMDLSGGLGSGSLLIGGAQFETDDPDLSWLNSIHSVFRGRTSIDEETGSVLYHDEYFEVR